MKKMTSKFSVLMISAFIAVGAGAGAVVAGEHGAGHGSAAKPMAAKPMNIVETAAHTGKFKTLAAALQAADLVATLEGAGPYTVFAPTDEAFAKLPAGTVEGLLKDPAKLKQVLLYHVVPGKVMAADVVKLKSAKTAQGGAATIAVKGKDVMINNAKVVMADVKASNGVIHVIDTVLMPK